MDTVIAAIRVETEWISATVPELTLRATQLGERMEAWCLVSGKIGVA
jgi:hypothetical protein